MKINYFNLFINETILLLKKKLLKNLANTLSIKIFMSFSNFL